MMAGWEAGKEGGWMDRKYVEGEDWSEISLKNNIEYFLSVCLHTYIKREQKSFLKYTCIEIRSGLARLTGFGAGAPLKVVMVLATERPSKVFSAV